MLTNQTLYCLSGLGADEKVFRHLRLDGYTLKHIPWLRPHRGETVEAYAARMAEGITEPNPILLGVSFGGMISIEIARQRPVKKLILISTVKSVSELPRWMRVAGRLRLNRLMPIRYYKFTERLGNYRLGVSSEEEKQLVRGYRESSDRVYLAWAINTILNWKNEWVPPATIHIHGDGDRIFPCKTIRADYVIKNATHLMIYNRADDVSDCIRKALET